ncbi:hypothetical protein [Flavobacterium pedocola]
MDFFIILSFLLIILPIIFQIFYEKKTISNTADLSFREVCFLSFIFQIFLTFLGFNITSKSLEARGFECGIAPFMIIGISFIVTLLMFIIMGIQLYIKTVLMIKVSS